MLERYRPGDRVAPSDAADLLSLVGGAAAYFDVVTTKAGPRSFRVARLVDAEPTPFSITELVAQRRPSALVPITTELRAAVASDLESARKTHLARRRDADGFVTCESTGDRILPADGHMAHLPPLTFEAMVTAFLGGLVPPTPLDRERIEDFRAYHSKHARLAFVQRHVKLVAGKARR